jgi:bifunctional DNA-binding transcriptional regulator/antitoxin component of YhaV-PrlF toxin-antitoxin module
MKAKTYSYKGRLYSEIPKEAAEALKIKSGDEIDFRPVYDNLVLIVPAGAAAEGELKEEEIAFLKKVNSIKHYERTYDSVSRILSSQEKKMLDELFKKDVLFEYRREGKKLLGIDKKYLKHVFGEKSELVDKLVKEGYLVLEDQAKVKELSDRLKQEKLAVRGIRGFDKRYYIVSSEKLAEIEGRLEKVLEKEKMLKTISGELGVSEELCRAALEILLEDGRVIEKKKNTYALA